MPDNYSQWEWHERGLEQRLKHRPVCEYCDNPVQDDHYYDIDGTLVCQDCLDAYFRKGID